MRVADARRGRCAVSRRTKAARRESFRAYVCDPSGDRRWWDGLGDEGRMGRLREGGFLRADVEPVALPGGPA